MSDVWYLALAYGAVWLGLVVYLFRLAGQAEALRKEVTFLKATLQGTRVGEAEEQPERLVAGITREAAG
ncbi:MAG: CcmD family protein [Dehalococcoidia bacterium]|nr:CcmD family protein [Dehalococcoidia bacterium]